MRDKTKDQKQYGGVNSLKIEIDEAGRVRSELPELTEDELNQVAGGMAPRGTICRIQTDPRGCSMNM